MMPSSHHERYIRSIFVQNIPGGITEDLFRQTLTQFGVLIHFYMLTDSNTNLDKNPPTPRSYAFAEFSSNEIAQTAIHRLNGLDLGGFRLIVDLLSNQSEPIRNLFEQLSSSSSSSSLSSSTTTITTTNKNDPRLANSTQSSSSGSINSTESTSNTNKEDKESISNAVASLPPAQMFELMKQMKQCIEANPNEAKTLLSTNPQLAYALLQAQVVMRIVDPSEAMTLLNRTDKDVIPTATDLKKPLLTTTTTSVTAPIPLPNPTSSPFPFSVLPPSPFSMPILPPNASNPQQAAAAALFQAALLSGAGMFPGSLIPPPLPLPPVQPTFPSTMRPTNLDENAALLLLQLDDAQLAQLPAAQSIQIRSLREQIAKTGLLPKI